MSTQLAFDLEYPPTVARKNDPATSKYAASKVKTGSRRSQIISAMVEMKLPKTVPNIAKVLGWRRDSVSPHLKPLELLGLVTRELREEWNPETAAWNTIWKLTDKVQSMRLQPTQAPRVCCECKRPL